MNILEDINLRQGHQAWVSQDPPGQYKEGSKSTSKKNGKIWSRIEKNTISKYLTGRGLDNATLSFAQHVYIHICTFIFITGRLEVENLNFIQYVIHKCTESQKFSRGLSYYGEKFTELEWSKKNFVTTGLQKIPPSPLLTVRLRCYHNYN